MELSTLFSAFDSSWVDGAVLWSVIGVTGIAGLAVVVNALDAFFDVG